MKIVVQDASILIDLVLSQTVDAWFATGIETWTTNLIYPLEVDRPDQRAILDPYVAAKHLKIRAIAAEEFAPLRALQAQHRALSLPDVSALFVTQVLGDGARLATGDRALRAAAQRGKLEACGLLGLMDIMVNGIAGSRHVLPAPVAAERLRRLLTHPECRLPKAECEARIRGWASR